MIFFHVKLVASTMTNKRQPAFEQTEKEWT